MTARFFRLTPQDTLFFRDGRPYEQQDDGLAQAHSLFPPYPTTLTGALRAAIARANGWNGNGGWENNLIQVLGDGPAMTGGVLRFGPPMLLHRADKATGWEPLYPAPLTLCRKICGKVWAYARLRPGKPVTCDLDDGVRLPTLPEGFTPTKDALRPGDLLLTSRGMELACGPDPLGPDFAQHVVEAKDLWKAEPRVGLELSAATRTAVRGRLYAPVHVRLRDEVALGQSVDGLPTDWAEPSALVPLGGEHRFAHLDPAPHPKAPTPQPAQVQDGRHLVSVTLLTPAFVDDGPWLQVGAEPVAGARLVSAVLGDLLPIGGWDSREKHRGPRALRPALPAGSTWFLEAAPTTLDDLRRPIGEENDTRHGFGAVMLGGWPEGEA